MKIIINAALRELKEETSIKMLNLLKKLIKKEFTYIFLIILIGIIWKGKYKGQNKNGLL